MKIRVFSHLHRPDRGGGASIFTDLSEGLAQRGHDVELFCSYPYYPEWVNKSGANLWRREREVVNGVSVVRHGMFIPRNPGSTVQRAAYEGSYALSLARSTFRSAPVDAVVAFLPLLSSGVAAMLDTKGQPDVPTWINVQDLSGRAAASYSGTIGKALTQVEEAVLARASLVTTIAPQMTAELSHLNTDGQKVQTFPNWLHSTAEASIVRARTAADAEDRHDRRRPLRLLYAGNIGKKQGVDRVVGMLAASDRNFEFEICGAGAGAEAVDQVLPAGDARFRRRPFLSEDEFIERLHWADAFVVPELPTDAASFLPSKLLPSTAAGTPILGLAGNSSPLRDEIEAHGIGAVADWSDPDSILVTGERLRTATYAADGVLERSLALRASAQSSAHAIDQAEEMLNRMVSGDQPASSPVPKLSSTGRPVQDVRVSSLV